uniref:Glycoside hydrolase family 5 domain-containing protein n=1 Tax=Acrobeloides nanus TaxID=290746 RepID=A0A914CKY1_9BILA
MWTPIILLALVPPAFSWRTGSHGVQWDENCDYSGNDLYSKPSTGEQCGDLCASDSSCTYFPIHYGNGYSVCGYIQEREGDGDGVPYGRLAVSEKGIVSAATGQPVQLRGMSLFWSQWMGQFYNADTVQALKCSWNTNVVRAAMGVEQDGYLSNPERELQKVFSVVDAAIANGMYVIVDWHDHNAINHQSQAPYHEAVIAAIRANDPDNIIVVGTPNWSQYVDEAANDPITNYKNIAYTLHYYAGTHKQDLRNRATAALNKGLPLFVTEYGTVNADGGGAVDTNESNLWWNFLDENQISYVNWALDDKDEGSAALIPGTTSQQVGDDSRLTASGRFVKDKYKSQNNGVHC